MARFAYAALRYLSNLTQPQHHSSTGPEHQITTSSEETRLQPTDQKSEDVLVSKPHFRSCEATDHGPRKRKAIEDENELSPRKRVMKVDQQEIILYNDDENFVSSLQSFPSPSVPNKISSTKAEKERELMPPPATPRGAMKPRSGQQLNSETIQGLKSWVHDDDATSFASSEMAWRKIDNLDAGTMEEARRHAAAVTLPVNSGIWSQTERELFFHLAYRGFEPLLPQNWMIDFDTLPISLFAHENTTDPPLIQNIRDNHFRAGHALRCLFEAGHDVRDRTHVSPGVRREKLLERSVKRYLYWALTDVGLRPTSKRNYIPVHVVVSKRKGRSTLQTLEEIAMKLHKLLERHQGAQNLHPSIEIHSPSMTDTGETRIIEKDASSPTLIGLVIISSVLTIVTLSSFSPSPPEKPISQTASPPRSDPSTQAFPDFNPDKLRIIAELDFSQKDQDVWNALGVAIVAIQILKETLKVNYGIAHDDISALDLDGMSNAGSRLEDELEGNTTFSRLELEDDPDL